MFIRPKPLVPSFRAVLKKTHGEGGGGGGGNVVNVGGGLQRVRAESTRLN